MTICVRHVHLLQMAELGVLVVVVGNTVRACVIRRMAVEEQNCGRGFGKQTHSLLIHGELQIFVVAHSDAMADSAPVRHLDDVGIRIRGTSHQTKARRSRSQRTAQVPSVVGTAAPTGAAAAAVTGTAIVATVLVRALTGTPNGHGLGIRRVA